MAPASQNVEKKLSKVEEKSIMSFYTFQLKFAMELLKDVPRPVADDDDNDENEPRTKILLKKPLPKRLYPALGPDKKPARTMEELQARIALLKGKTKLSYKQKLLKKGLKDKLKKKEKKELRIKAKELQKKMKMESKMNLKESKSLKPVKPVYNNEGQMIFSKFDFSDIGNQKAGKKPHTIKDPKVTLEKMKKEDEFLKAMKEKGEEDKAIEIKQKKTWKKVLMKSEGVKIKDNPELLKKTIKKEKYKKQKSAKKWKAREEKVKKDQEDRQNKRTENIKARARQKKLGKMKKAAKRGRIVAGF